MKIAFLSFYNGLNFRGAETFVHELAGRLAKSGQTVTVYQHGDSKKTDYQTRLQASETDLPKFDPVPDIVFPVNGRLQAVKARIWAFTHRSKVVISGQSGLGIDDRLNLYTFPDAFIGLTDYQCAWARRINPKVRVEKIPNGVNLEIFNPQTRPAPIGLPKPVILYVAALEPIKRCDLLIKAVSQTGGSLLIVGKGSLQPDLTDLGNRLLPGRFKIESFPYNQMPSVYTACDLYTYPTSPWESFGISMLEAMACGLPVVATDDPIRREIVGPAGILADPQNQTEFAGAISRALKSKWNTKPQTRAAGFSWDLTAKAYLELFKQLVNPS